MSTNMKDFSTLSHSINSDEDYVYICKTDPIQKGVWTNPAEFIWAIGEYGRKILLAGFLSSESSPQQIALAFCQGKFHAELSTQYGQVFICNNYDIVNAHHYMSEKRNVKFQQSFNEKNRNEWEQVPEHKMEVAKWIDELKKALHALREALADVVRDINNEFDVQIFLLSIVAAIAFLTAYAVEAFFGR